MSLQRFFANLSKATPEDRGDKPARLGRSGLGWYAYEQQMPARLLALHQGELVEHGTRGIIDVLYRACEQDDSVESAYFCHPSVQYIGKLRWEGSFCGYRNIQMLVSYLVGAQAPGCEQFLHGVPSVLKIQDLIEEAWDKGINSDGRIETGGIKGTRKHIGTPEVQALFKSLEISCRGATYNDNPETGQAWERLGLFVRQYFSAATVDPTTGVHQTNLPPIYLQRPRHSLTIVGYQICKDGSFNLLVFDPGSSPSADMRSAVEENGQLERSWSQQSARALLAPYSLRKEQLRRYKNFETLILTSGSRA